MGNEQGKLAPVITFLAAEQKTWLKHAFLYDADVRTANLGLVDQTFKDDQDFIVGAQQSSYGGVAYRHFFISNASRSSFLEFGSASVDIYTARVQINTLVRHGWDVVSTQKVTPGVRNRMKQVVGMMNYSLCLRNCEHVTNYISRNSWSSVQMTTDHGGLFETFKQHLIGNHRKLINILPNTYGGVEVDSAAKVYPAEFSKNTCKAVSVEYFLDENENTYNAVVIGPTGSGKSRLVNVLFNQELCVSRASLESVTKDVTFVRGTAVIKDKVQPVIVADVIGLCDTQWDDKEVVQLIKSKINANCNKIDAVIVLLKADRLEQHHVAGIKEIMKWLNYTENHLNFTFLFSRSEHLSDAEKTTICEEATAIFGLKTSDFAHSDTQKVEQGLRKVQCVGFPAVDTLNEVGTQRVKDSINVATFLFRSPAPRPIYLDKTIKKCPSCIIS